MSASTIALHSARNSFLPYYGYWQNDISVLLLFRIGYRRISFDEIAGMASGYIWVRDMDLEGQRQEKD